MANLKAQVKAIAPLELGHYTRPLGLYLRPYQPHLVFELDNSSGLPNQRRSQQVVTVRAPQGKVHRAGAPQFKQSERRKHSRSAITKQTAY